jgi:NADH-quinone oxidoreductase subunit L
MTQDYIGPGWAASHHAAAFDPLLLIAWLLPLAGAVLLWAFGPALRRASGYLATLVVFASFGLTLADAGRASALSQLGGYGNDFVLGSWTTGFGFGLLWDPLALLWTLVITGVGGLIHLYSIGYMAGDRALARFFAYMNFFVFAMLTLVLSDNFVGLLIGWGLVGAASYFLIGFWFARPTAVAAARKAFVINVVGDVGLMFAIFVLFASTGSTMYGDVFAKVGEIPHWALILACVTLFVACAAKSAQIPLHTWLPDAMEGPTPVSALIHAATMVTAGVYLIARCAPLWDGSAEARVLVGSIGALTALVGALLGLAQWDIKRILAYSTMSQIGYMIMGVGVGAFQAGILHFYAHAFFKALLFLAAGLIIHELADEQDVRKMGGLIRRTPVAWWGMLAGTLALIGFPGLSGFFSKDAVIYGTLEQGYPVLYAIAVLTAGLTAYYMLRMLFLTFGGSYRGALTRRRPRRRSARRGPRAAVVDGSAGARADRARARVGLRRAWRRTQLVVARLLGRFRFEHAGRHDRVALGKRLDGLGVGRGARGRVVGLSPLRHGRGASRRPGAHPYGIAPHAAGACERLLRRRRDRCARGAAGRDDRARVRGFRRPASNRRRRARRRVASRLVRT